MAKMLYNKTNLDTLVCREAAGLLLDVLFMWTQTPATPHCTKLMPPAVSS